MQISHEVPLSLMKDSYKFNDYDYALVHLYDEIEEYKDFFINSVKNGRKVILDNSVFELETLFDSEKFAQQIINTKPTEYIIPDALEDMETTIVTCEKWLKEFKDVPGIKIGVVQGKTYNEIVECYNFMKNHVDKIAISFDYSYYENSIKEDVNKYFKWMIGRISLINKMLSDNIIDTSKPHHLLGCSLPQEFQMYQSMNWIETIDTSNPVVHAILGIPYEKYGLPNKASIKLIELINSKEENIDKNILDHNIKMFKHFCKGC